MRSKVELKWALLALLVLSAPLVSFADEYGDEEEESGEKGDDEDVVVLTTKNFDELINKYKFALVEFYAPWCGHCKSLKPHYAKAATSLKATNPDVMIAKVDATQESELGKKFGVEGYPTLKWFIDGELASDFNGGRDADAIVKWVAKKAGPATIEVATADALAELEKEHTVLVVGYFPAKEGDVYSAFSTVASKIEDVTFAETASADVATAAGLEKDSIAVIKNFPDTEREVAKFEGEASSDAINTFVIGEKLPLSIEFTQDNSEKIFNSGLKRQILLWTKASDLVAGSEVLKAFHTASKAFKGKIVFVTVDSEGESADPVTNFFGLKDAVAPQIIGFYMEKNKKYKMTTELTAENLLAFAAAVEDGTATSEYKSAPIPEEGEDKDGDVQIIVGKTVDAIVKAEDKDVLLEVYAPWCGHCKKLDPIYKKLAKRFKSVSSVVIAKMDGTENEHADIEVKGFPTILFYPAGKGAEPITFEGDRSLKGMTKFLKENAVIPYELPKKGDAAEKAAESGSAKDEL